ncbi:hypothetical protein CN507_07680 [Bacillus cereus]|nr:hypothetical protein CN507_07680 [Bacillus cereus]
MLMKWEYEHFSSGKQSIEYALTMWKEWISKKMTYTDDLAVKGTMYVVNHMTLRGYQVSLLFDFFNEYLTLLNQGEEQAEAFYKSIMKI